MMVEGMVYQIFLALSALGFLYAVTLSWQLKRAYEKVLKRGVQDDRNRTQGNEILKESKDKLDALKVDVESLIKDAEGIKSDLSYYVERSEKVLNDMEPVLHQCLSIYGNSTFKRNLEKKQFSEEQVLPKKDKVWKADVLDFPKWAEK